MLSCRTAVARLQHLLHICIGWVGGAAGQAVAGCSCDCNVAGPQWHNGVLGRGRSCGWSEGGHGYSANGTSHMARCLPSVFKAMREMEQRRRCQIPILSPSDHTQIIHDTSPFRPKALRDEWQAHTVVTLCHTNLPLKGWEAVTPRTMASHTWLSSFKSRLP